MTGKRSTEYSNNSFIDTSNIFDILLYLYSDWQLVSSTYAASHVTSYYFREETPVIGCLPPENT